MIKIEGLCKSVSNGGERHAILKDFNCHVHPGEIVSLIGGQASGKTTLLRLIMGLDTPDSGSIVCNGTVGMVFQEFNLFLHLNVLDNVRLALTKVRGKSMEAATEHAMSVLRSIGMASKAELPVKKLSGGEKQRVAIARSIAMNPDVLLLDEPTSALDPTKVHEVQSVIKKLARDGITMVIVSHDMNFVRDVSTRVMFLAGGCVHDEGTPDYIFGSEVKPLTSAFIQSQRELRFTVKDRDFDIYQMNGDIDWFCQKYEMQDRRMAVQLVLEELLTAILPFTGEIEIVIRYDSSLESFVMNLTQMGCSSSIMSSPDADELSLMIVKGMCTRIEETVSADRTDIVFTLSHSDK